MTTKPSQSEVPRSPRRHGVGFCFICCAALFSSGCCLFSRTSHDDAVAIIRQLEERNTELEVTIQELRLQVSEQNAEIAALRENIAEQSAGDQKKRGESDED